ncbi:MAG: isoprenylcysteine carboxylmethyltransferase family protein, partial [Phycisphaerales bacterium]
MEGNELRTGNEPTRLLLARACLDCLFSLGVFGGLLFWAAGTLSWTRGWIHYGLWIVTLVANLVILHRMNPDVFAVRLKRQRVSEKFDKVVLPLAVPAALAIPVVAGLDAVRYEWTFLPLWAICPGVVVHVAGDAFALWAMIVNPYVEKEVRIQTERGHRVITTGPYAIVRHPMYVSFILIVASIPLVLGSWWAFLPAGVVGLALIIRTTFEDRMLREKMPGYED